SAVGQYHSAAGASNGPRTPPFLRLGSPVARRLGGLAPEGGLSPAIECACVDKTKQDPEALGAFASSKERPPVPPCFPTISVHPRHRPRAIGGEQAPGSGPLARVERQRIQEGRERVQGRRVGGEEGRRQEGLTRP